MIIVGLLYLICVDTGIFKGALGKNTLILLEPPYSWSHSARSVLPLTSMCREGQKICVPTNMFKKKAKNFVYKYVS